MMQIRHVLVALLLHVGVLVFILIGAYFQPPPIKPLPVIEAVLIASKAPAVPEAPKEVPKKEEPKKEEPKPDPKIEEQKKLVQEQKKLEEQKKKEEIKLKVDLAKKKIEEEKKLKQQEDLDRKRQMEQEVKEVADAKRKREQEAELKRQADLQAQLDKERQGRMATEQERWIAMITNKIQRNWVRPINSADKFDCKLNVQILPGGSVIDVKLTRGCGSTALDESVKRAVLKSDPLPMPADPEVFDRNLNFTFIPQTN
jgi:colicin import membrane protein